jgi:2-iminobutanoate/2-iminopropanoate deaminase
MHPTLTSAPFLLLFLAGGCQAPVEAARGPEFLKGPATSALTALPFSEAVRAGDFLFLAGQIGNVPGKLELVPGGMAAEAEQVMQNVVAVLERHGARLDDVVKVTVFLADMRDWPAFNEVYRRHFTRNLPARSAAGANGLAIGAKVEVECIAYVPRR